MVRGAGYWCTRLTAAHSEGRADSGARAASAAHGEALGVAAVVLTIDKEVETREGRGAVTNLHSRRPRKSASFFARCSRRFASRICGSANSDTNLQCRLGKAPPNTTKSDAVTFPRARNLKRKLWPKVTGRF